MNLNNARYILTILKEGNYSTAAQKLYISQPALSQTVRKVEKNLGTPIFVRNGNKLKLTYAGERYIQTARQMLILENNLKNEINEINKEKCGVLRFGIPMQQSVLVLPLILREFMAKYPRVILGIEEAGSSALENMISEGTLDIALARTSCQQNTIAYQLIQKEKIGLLVGKGTKLFDKYANGTEIDLAEVQDEFFVSLKEGHSVRTIQEKMFDAKKISVSKMIELDSFETAKRVAVNCGGVMIAPLSMVELSPDILSKAHFYPLKQVQNDQHTYIIYQKNLYLTRYMRDWIKMIRRLYSKNLGGIQ